MIKRKEFQWEEVYHFAWKAISANTSFKEEDTWLHTDWIPLDDCVEKLISYARVDHSNTYPYRLAQLNSLRLLSIVYNIDLPDEKFILDIY